MYSSNKELIIHLLSTGILQSENIKEAFYNIDRKDFVLKEDIGEAYNDYPLPIGYKQTISQPSTVAFMLELLEPKLGDNILDIGSGSGWTTTLLGYIVGEIGSVVGLERIQKLVNFGSNNLKKYNLKNTKIKKAQKELGIPGEKFDKILVSAAATELPKELINQLKVGGILVIPVQDSIMKIIKVSDKNYSIKKYTGFRFVPLIKN